MEMARVIVDVPSKDTDRPFDYLIPEELRPWVEVGSRVGVPFGHRTLQGFVVSLHPRPEMDTAKMKSIQEVLDVMPPLSPELIELGEWMKERYACRYISALQSMLPTALKGKAERYISLGDPEAGSTDDGDGLLAILPESELEKDILRFVGQRGEVSFQQLMQAFPDAAASIKALIGRGKLSEHQQIKDKLQKKTMKAIELAVSGEEARLSLASFPAKAQRQKEVLQYILEMEDFLPIAQKELLQTLGVSAGTVKGLADKGLITIEDIEVFRDPYRGRHFTPVNRWY